MRGKQVVLIEDEPNIAEAISFILSRAGARVKHLASGAGAEEVLLRIRPDVLVLDLMLPDRSGLEILAELRATPMLAALPVLMLTARGHSRDREAAGRAGASAFLAKPFANADLLAAVRALAGGAD